MINHNIEPAVNAKYNHGTAQQNGTFEFASSNAGDSISKCNTELDANNPIQPVYSSNGDDVRSAMVDRARENRNQSQPESSLEDETSENLNVAPTAELEHDEAPDPYKSINDIRELLVGPTQRQNESRLSEIITLVEKSRKESDQNIELLRKQFAHLSLKLYDKTKDSLSKLDDRLNSFKATVEANHTEIHGAMALEVSGLEGSMDNKVQSISDSVDARIFKLTTKINGEMSNTISELGRAISSVGSSAWQSD